MVSLSLRRFHSVLIVPVLLLLLLLFSSHQRTETNMISATDATYTAHGTYYGRFHSSSRFVLYLTVQFHGTLSTLGQFNGYSQTPFIYEPNHAYVGGDSFTYHACDSKTAIALTEQ